MSSPDTVYQAQELHHQAAMTKKMPNWTLHSGRV
jgi:hypothetical protein